MKFTFTLALLVLCVLVVTAYRVRKKELFNDDDDDYKILKKYDRAFDVKKMMDEDCSSFMASCVEDSECCSKKCSHAMCVESNFVY